MPYTLKTTTVVICLAAILSASIVHGAECTLLATTKYANSIQADKIVRPGEFCLGGDIRAARRYDFGGERADLDALLTVQAPQVDIDLRGFGLYADTLNLRGVWLSPAYGTELREVSLRNGSLISRTRSSIGFPELKGTTPADFRVLYRKQSSAEDAYAEFRDGWAKSAASLQPSDISIDSVTIKANTRTDVRPCPECFGVALKGRRNVIRNSRIEISNGQAGALFVGPDNLIEHCTIVFKGKAATGAAAAIKLYAAHNTVIRDNDIVIESDDDTAPVAILLTDSKNVTLEGNRFYGVKTVTRMDEQSSYAVERNNQSLSRFKALFLK